MKKYIKIYCRYFNYVEDKFISSELSGKVAQDIHHLKLKSRGGKDNIENLIALTREEHERAHGGDLKENYLQKVHDKFKKRYDEKYTRNTNS